MHKKGGNFRNEVKFFSLEVASEVLHKPRSPILPDFIVNLGSFSRNYSVTFVTYETIWFQSTESKIFPNVKFHENSSSVKRFVLCGQIDRHLANSPFSQMFAKASNMLTPFILTDIQQGHHYIPGIRYWAGAAPFLLHFPRLWSCITESRTVTRNFHFLEN
jgi:hypothetical protein